MIGQLINTAENIEYGFLIAFILTILELILLAMMKSSKKLNIISYIMAIILCGLLTFQMSRLVGAFNINTTVSDVQNVIGMFSQTVANAIGDITGISQRDIGWFIFRRVMWSLLFMGIAGVVIYQFMTEKDYGGHNFSNRHDHVSSRHSQTSSRNHRYH